MIFKSAPGTPGWLSAQHADGDGGSIEEKQDEFLLTTCLKEKPLPTLSHPMCAN